jgi:hypothetical protein
MKLQRITMVDAPQVIGLYGYSGVGKTSFAATGPRPLFLFSSGYGGQSSIADEFPKARKVDISTMADLDKVYKRMRVGGKWRGKFGLTIFDHFDDIQAMVIENLGEAAAERDDRMDPDIIGKREWGIVGNRMRRYLRKFKANVNTHQVLICMEREDRDTGRLQPALLGQLSVQFPGFLDHIMYMRVGSKGRRWIHLDPTKDFYAKTRTKWLPDEQRKFQFRLSNKKALTEFLELIAAGPGKTNRGDKEK